MCKPDFKLVTDFPITEYRCGARAGEQVRLRRNIVMSDSKGTLTDEVHKAGEVWTVIAGAAEEPRALWLRQADGEIHTWSDDSEFWIQFERVN
jgi:hypothetical protein